MNLDLAEKQYAAAEQRVQQQIANNPKSVPLQLMLADILAVRGDTNGAETTLQHAIELQPDARQAYIMLAKLYLAENQNQKVIATLRTALTKNPEDGDALMLLGLTCEVVKDYRAPRTPTKSCWPGPRTTGRP